MKELINLIDMEKPQAQERVILKEFQVEFHINEDKILNAIKFWQDVTHCRPK